MDSPLAQMIITGILGGGAATGIAALYRARIEKQRDDREDRKLPAELDSIVVGGAEQAVTTMARALKHANEQLTAQQENLAQERQARQAVEGQLRTALAKLDRVERTTDRLQRQLTATRAELTQTRNELAAIRKRGDGHGHVRRT